ncbi:TatD family hydrolase [bacterium]|nr:TatD family hydrolase [bacterium]
MEYPSAEKIREAIRNIKSAKILTETDAPFLPPQTMRGQQNEPAYVTYVYEKLCDLSNITQEHLENIIKKNTKSLYSL